MSRTTKSQSRKCSCSRCQQGRQFNGTKRAAIAAQQVAELDLPGAFEAPEFPHVGLDANCDCPECRDLWLDMLWATFDVSCEACGGECRL